MHRDGKTGMGRGLPRKTGTCLLAPGTTGGREAGTRDHGGKRGRVLSHTKTRPTPGGAHDEMRWKLTFRWVFKFVLDSSFDTRTRMGSRQSTYPTFSTDGVSEINGTWGCMGEFDSSALNIS